MSLTKQVVIDQITVNENGVVLYREATRIIEDGKQISQTYHRTSLVPGQDILNEPSNVVAICMVVWTPQVISDYQASIANVTL